MLLELYKKNRTVDHTTAPKISSTDHELHPHGA